jgi:hypothetical protein
MVLMQQLEQLKLLDLVLEQLELMLELVLLPILLLVR